MADLELVIGNKNYSSWSLRAWLAMRAAEVPFRETTIALDEDRSTETKLEHAPTALVPVLHDGRVTVWDSLAICEYVAERFPDRGMWPADPAARARARSICAEMHSGFGALRSELPMNCRARRERKPRSPGVARDIERIRDSWRDTRATFGGTGGPFLFGAFSIADAFYAPVASRFFTYDIGLDDATTEYVDALFSHPAMQTWMVDAENEPMEIPATDRFE